MRQPTSRRRARKRYTLAIIIFLAFATAASFLWSARPHHTIFGASFSPAYARYLGLDWKDTYQTLLDDVGIQELRLMAYWNEIEPREGVFDFKDLDWQIAEARARDARVLLAIGYKLPHWPECHIPAWTQHLTADELHAKTLAMLRETVEHYRNEAAIIAWQVENEPTVGWFGKCPFRPTLSRLKEEIALVRKLDQRPIYITDSGELSSWFSTAHLGDKFGTTLYRVVWNKVLGGYWHYDYFFPPLVYAAKAMVHRIPPADRFVAELQAEPWAHSGILDTPLSDQAHSMNPRQFKRNIQFAVRTGFSPVYLWGAEWWIWLAKQGDSSMLEAAKKVFQ